MAGTPEHTPERERELSIEALTRQLDAVRRDAAVLRERLTRLSEVERFRALSDTERVLTTEWHAALRAIGEEIRNLEDRIASAR